VNLLGHAIQPKNVPIMAPRNLQKPLLRASAALASGERLRETDPSALDRLAAEEFDLAAMESDRERLGWLVVRMTPEPYVYEPT
jgi:hypothetical protein